MMLLHFDPAPGGEGGQVIRVDFEGNNQVHVYELRTAGGQSLRIQRHRDMTSGLGLPAMNQFVRVAGKPYDSTRHPPVPEWWGETPDLAALEHQWLERVPRA